MKSVYAYYNPNPLKNVKAGDCVIRALCKATGKEWDVVFKELFEVAFERKAMMGMNEVWIVYLERSGFVKRSFRITKGMKRPTVESFTKAHKKGTYVLNVANHIVTSQDGRYYDTWDCGNKSLYNYWEKEA